MKRLTSNYKKELIAEARRRGFKNKVNFTSATGMPNAFCKGKLIVKENYDPDDESEHKFNGDLVSSAGWGLIYDATKDKWGEVS
jgi:hypothetical protein